MNGVDPKLSVVVPVFNEEDLLESTVENLIVSLKEIEPTFELILSQNGSTDHTSELAEQLAQKHVPVRVIHYPRPDYGRALQNGFIEAQGVFLVNFSIDFIDLDFLRAALPMLATYDIVLGSKHITPGTDRRPPLRRHGGRAFHWLVQGLFGLSVRDTHGIKAYRRDRVLGLIARCRQGGALFDTELILWAHRAGLRLREIPVQVEETRPSRSGITRRALESLMGLVRLRFVLWREGGGGFSRKPGFST
jgi:glycosyltransferase involved in cell wall biosynthesis